jgi:N utilization substance protein B
MGLRHQGRELALKALYRIDICGGASSDDLTALFESFPVEDDARRFAVQLMEGVRREQPALDKHLADALEHWSVKRLSRVDHNVMRIAIDEAIELAKCYGDIESGRFVNGVLDEIAGRLGLKQKGEDVTLPKAE